jgi:hypothetical protein
VKWKRQSRSSRPCVSTAEATVSTTHGNRGDRGGFFSLTRGTCGQTLSTAGACGGGPTIRLVLSESGHSCRGWRDNSRKHIVSNDAIL